MTNTAEGKIIESTNRLEWLNARKMCVTASEITKISSGTTLALQSLANEKQSPVSEIQGNRAMDWGHEREPFIVAAIQEKFPEYSIEPNDQLFINRNNMGYGATPDGIGVVNSLDGEDVTNVEVKTTNDLDRKKAPKDHYDQMQWAMLVTGAARCIYAWEPHIDYTPQDVQFQIVDRDEDRIAELRSYADRALEYINSTVEPVEDAYLDSLIEEYALLNHEFKNLENKIKLVKNKIRDTFGENEMYYQYKGKSGSYFNYSKPAPRRILDQDRIKNEHPDIAEECTKLSNTSFGIKFQISKELEQSVLEHYQTVDTSDDNPFA